MKAIKTLAVIFAVILTLGCQDSGKDKPQASEAKSENEQAAAELNENKAMPQDQTPPGKPVKDNPGDREYPYKGTIQYFDLEGGFVGIVTETGDKYLPMGLDKEYLQAGAVIEFDGQVQEDVMTIQQWGKPFKITKIKLIKAGKPIEPKPQNTLN